MTIRPRRFVAALGVIVIVISGYVGSQLHIGQQLSDQYSVDTQKIAQESENGSGPAPSETPASDEISSKISQNKTPSSSATTYQHPSALASQADASTPVSSAKTPSAANYKKSMVKTYEQMLQAMQTIKNNTLALQSRKISLSSYKASIIQSQTTFSSAEAFVRANPPKDAKLNTPYQELLAGISLAKQAMAVALNGISSYSISELYSARDMGVTAQQQVMNGYDHL